MLITLIVLQVLILLVLCVIARRLPKQTNVVNSFTVGDVATKEQMGKFWDHAAGLLKERPAS